MNSINSRVGRGATIALGAALVVQAFDVLLAPGGVAEILGKPAWLIAVSAAVGAGLASVAVRTLDDRWAECYVQAASILLGSCAAIAVVCFVDELVREPPLGGPDPTHIGTVFVCVALSTFWFVTPLLAAFLRYHARRNGAIE